MESASAGRNSVRDKYRTRIYESDFHDFGNLRDSDAGSIPVASTNSFESPAACVATPARGTSDALARLHRLLGSLQPRPRHVVLVTEGFVIRWVLYADVVIVCQFVTDFQVLYRNQRETIIQ